MNALTEQLQMRASEFPYKMTLGPSVPFLMALCFQDQIKKMVEKMEQSRIKRSDPMKTHPQLIYNT